MNLFKPKVYTKSQYVFKQDEKAEFVYFIAKGDFKLTKKLPRLLTEEKNNFPENNLYRKFEKKKLSPTRNVDLVVKSEKEIIGVEEILKSASKRPYSCVCSSAIAEVYIVSKSDFLNKLLKSEAAEDFFARTNIDSE